MMLENKEAVIFDLDGTITDSMWVWADIDRTFFEQRKIPMPPTLNKEIEGGYFINHTYTRYKHYFLVEDKKAMKALNKYRENIISYSKFA